MKIHHIVAIFGLSVASSATADAVRQFDCISNDVPAVLDIDRVGGSMQLHGDSIAKITKTEGDLTISQVTDGFFSAINVFDSRSGQLVIEGVSPHCNVEGAQHCAIHTISSRWSCTVQDSN